MSSTSATIKQIAAGRRKPNMTQKEYFDHRFRIHGSLSDGVEDLDLKPSKYIQTQVFDSAFGSRAGGPLNANQHWVGRDDTTELYFRDWDHVLACFGGDYVKQKIGPDGPLFADFETSMILMAAEKHLGLQTSLHHAKAGVSLGEGDATIAMFWISTPDNQREGKELEERLSPLLVKALETHAQEEAWDLLVNIGTLSSKFDLNAYFGGLNMPQYALVYKIMLKDSASVPAVRKAQAAFAESAGGLFDPHTSFALFAKEALILDMENGRRFDRNRQPVFQELPGPSHLDA